MKKIILLAFSQVLLGNAALQAQSWTVGGNNLTNVGRIGSNTNSTVAFETNNKERGRVTNAGLWGFGTSLPTAKLHINSVAGQIPFRIQVGGSTKFLVHNEGGVTIGMNATPPANGLYVSGDAGFGTTFPLAKIHINSAAGQYPLRAQVNGLTALQVYFNGGVSVGSAAIPPPNGLSVNLGNSGFGTAIPGDYKVKIVHDIFGLNLEQKSTGNHWEFLTSSTNTLFLYYNRMIRGFFDHTSGVYSSVSDERLKTNIKPMPSVLEKINQLKPATYQFKDVLATEITNSTEGNTPDTYGFLAQDVMKVFPHLVKHHVEKNRNLDTYSLDYSGFGIIAIKAIQELRQTVQEQQQENYALQQRLARIEAALALGDKYKLNSIDLTGISLEQNTPNPVYETTTFRYSIPDGTKAQILVYNSTTGKLIKTLQAPSNGQVNLSTADLEAGTYIYTLVVDGKQAAAKQFVLFK